MVTFWGVLNTDLSLGRHSLKVTMDNGDFLKLHNLA